MPELSESQTTEMLTAISDELGLEAYHLYPDTKRLIPEAVLLSIAAACVAEFLKGLFGLKELGEGIRNKVLELGTRWREKQDLEPYIQTLNLRVVMKEMLAAAPASPAPEELERAEQNLRLALMEFGVRETIAATHAAAMRRIIEANLWTGNKRD